MNAIINGHEYLLSSGYGMDDKKSKYYLNIITDSIDELVDVIGDEATLEIPNEFIVTGLSLNSITKNFVDANPVCSVTLSTYPYEDVLNGHTEDIEVISEAIEELAEIVATVQSEDIEVLSQAIEELAEIVAGEESKEEE